MKTLAPIFVVLIILMAFISAMNAQTQNRIYNPDLPQHLVFQWRIETDAVHPQWNNNDFTITRSSEGMVVFYGTYQSLAHALASVPALPQNVNTENVSLVPFFNQRSITAADAFALMGSFNNAYAMEENAVSFSVYFQTFETVVHSTAVPQIEEELSFEIQPNYSFAYSAGEFESLEAAENYKNQLVNNGYPGAEVNKYLNGQKVAMLELEEIFAYVDWNY